MNYKQLATEILNKVGGAENIESAIHCSTRLRMKLKDTKLPNVDEIKALDGVMGALHGGGQFQVIIGNDVSYVYNELSKMLPETNETEVVATKKDRSFKGLFGSFAELITGIFQPIIPAIAASGMLKALLLLVTSLGLMSKEGQIYQLLIIIADGAFYFLPLLLAYTSALKFKTNPYVSVALASVLVHPKLIALLGGEVPVYFAGLPVPNVAYSSSVLPIILTVWIMSYVERFAGKISPKPVKIFLQPLIVILVMAPLSLIALGPLGNYLGQGVSTGLFWIQDQIGWPTVALLSIFMPLIVMFGMHKVFYPVIFAAMASPGYEMLIHSAMLSSNIAQGAGALAVWMMAKDVKLKQIALPAGISGLFGITEPALYGIHLRLKKTLIACMIGAGAAGAFAGYVGLKAYAPVGPGVASLPMFIGEGNNFIYALITLAISLVVTPIAVYFIGFDNPDPEATKETSATKTSSSDKQQLINKEHAVNHVNKANTRTVVFAPLEGEVVPLSEVNDEAFSQEAMGKGMAIKPTSGKVVAPFDGVVDTIFKTKHSIGLRSLDGVEVLIHIGLDTVKLKGQYFHVHVQEGATIKHGDLLIEFDLEAIKQAGYDVTTPIIITNTAQYLEVLGHQNESVTGPSKPLITVL